MQYRDWKNSTFPIFNKRIINEWSEYLYGTKNN